MPGHLKVYVSSSTGEEQPAGVEGTDPCGVLLPYISLWNLKQMDNPDNKSLLRSVGGYFF